MVTSTPETKAEGSLPETTQILDGQASVPNPPAEQVSQTKQPTTKELLQTVIQKQNEAEKSSKQIAERLAKLETPSDLPQTPKEILEASQKDAGTQDAYSNQLKVLTQEAETLASAESRSVTKLEEAHIQQLATATAREAQLNYVTKENQRLFDSQAETHLAKENEAKIENLLVKSNLQNDPYAITLKEPAQLQSFIESLGAVNASRKEVGLSPSSGGQTDESDEDRIALKIGEIITSRGYLTAAEELKYKTNPSKNNV